MKSDMTLEQVRDSIKKLYAQTYWECLRQYADAIDAHLTQSAEASEPMAAMDVREAITDAIGFEWGEGELQTVNGNDLLRIAALSLPHTNATPEGFVLVPVEPTTQMSVCAAHYIDKVGEEEATVNGIYRAMLSAAPRSGGG